MKVVNENILDELVMLVVYEISPYECVTLHWLVGMVLGYYEEMMVWL